MNIKGIYSVNQGEREIFVTNLAHVYDEVRSIIFETQIYLKPETHANGVGGIKEALRDKFLEKGWTPEILIANPAYSSGGTKIDFSKRLHNGFGIAVETQFGYESRIQDDFSRLQEAIVRKEFNVGIVIVPMHEISQYLTDRVATFEAAIRTYEGYPASYRDLRAVLIGVTADGLGEQPLKKQRRRMRQPR